MGFVVDIVIGIESVYPYSTLSVGHTSRHAGKIFACSTPSITRAKSVGELARKEQLSRVVLYRYILPSLSIKYLTDTFLSACRCSADWTISFNFCRLTQRNIFDKTHCLSAGAIVGCIKWEHLFTSMSYELFAPCSYSNQSTIISQPFTVERDHLRS